MIEVIFRIEEIDNGQIDIQCFGNGFDDGTNREKQVASLFKDAAYRMIVNSGKKVTELPVIGTQN